MPRELRFDNQLISDDAPPFVIAEIGHNHAGEMDKAKVMIDSAIAAGASAVKFQTRNPREVYSRAEYNKTSDNPQWMDPVYGKHREALEPSKEEWQGLFDYCKSKDITFISTPFDFTSVDLLEEMGVPGYKVASGDATNIPMIEYIAKLGKPTLISTGGCSIEDVDRLHEAFTKHNDQLAILQCSCIYPCPPEVMNLNVIAMYRERYPDTVVGLSTHQPNWAVNIAAYTLGGRVFENHYNNDRDWKGTDNNFSLTPEMLTQFVSGVNEVRVALGSHEKFQEPVEASYTLERRKKLVARRDIAVGHVIEEADLAIKCPGDGLQPWQLNDVVGKPALEAIEAEEDITSVAVFGE